MAVVYFAGLAAVAVGTPAATFSGGATWAVSTLAFGELILALVAISLRKPGAPAIESYQAAWYRLVLGMEIRNAWRILHSGHESRY
jgi:hypothetical protein